MKRLLVLLLLTGCAAERAPEVRPDPLPSSGGSPAEGEQLEALRGRLVQYDGELRDSLAEPKPRCERQCGLAEQMCELSEKICSIAQRHADDAEHDYAETCRDGRARCARARTQVATCACPAP